MATHNLRCIAFFFLLTIVSGVTSFLTQNQFNRVIGNTKLRIQELSSKPQNSTIFDLIGATNLTWSNANLTSIQVALNVTGGRILFDSFTFNDMTTFLNMTQQQGMNLALDNFLQSVDVKLVKGINASTQPVAFAAYKKGIPVLHLLTINLIELGSRLTGFTVPIMQKLYKISDVDLATARRLPFGGLPTYVNQTMNVKSEVRHFYTLSLDSITRAMLIHKNQTEGTMDFIKDFGFIARSVSIGEIKLIYNISDALIKLPSLFMLSNLISSIDYSQFQVAMNDKSTLNLRDTRISEMTDYMNLSDINLNKLSILGLRNKFNSSVSASSGLSRLPVAVAAHRKGIMIMQMLMMNIIDLAGNVTGFTVPIMRKLYNISDADLVTARMLPFGGLPGYVNMTMNVRSQLNHFYTLSLDSITRAMLIHKNQTEGTMDFIKEFGFIARNVSIGEIKAIYSINSTNIKVPSPFMLSNLISGIDYSQFQLAMLDRSALNLKEISIGQMVDYMNLSDSDLNNISIAGLRNKFNFSISAGRALARMPVAVAAHRKGITVMKFLMMNLIDLSGNITGFTVPIMQKLYKISDVDLATARRLPFGGLPTYVNQTMNVKSEVRHFYTLSLDSITRAMLIHKNQTEGTMDFIKDFGFIARNVSIGEIKLIYNISDARIKLSSLFMLSNLISGIDYSQFQVAMLDRSALNLKEISIGQMVDYMNLSDSDLNNISIAGLRNKFNFSISAGRALARMPVAVAAHRKGITVMKFLMMNLIDLSGNITGFTVPIMQKLYKISDVDLATARRLPFGGLPTYVNQTMNVKSEVRHFYTLSLDSITRAMLIHKNQTEGTMDFIKDFGFIARNVSIGEIKLIYNISDARIKLSSLFMLSNLISGIDYSQFQVAMNDKSTLNLRDTRISEMTDYMNLSDIHLNKLSIVGLRNKFNSSVSASSALSRLPVAVAAHRKGIMIMQMLTMSIIDLAGNVTGFTVPIMQKLYNISDVDLAAARGLPFGGLPGYVNMTMNVTSQLNHFYTLSLDSITRAMLIHKNQTEGTMDFIKDFGFIARNVSIGEIKAIYSVNSTNIKVPSPFMLSNFISGINYSQFQLAMRDRSALNLRDLSIGQMANYMRLSEVDLNILSIIGLRNRFNSSVRDSSALSRLPVAVAAHRKGMTIMQILTMNVIDLAHNVTGFTLPIMQKLYNISNADLATKRMFPFGGLPAYVNQTMNVKSQLNHFYTLSLDSITRAMLIHKNQTEGTMDFIKDFGFIAKNVSIGEIKAIYNISSTNIKLPSLFMLSNLISGIDYSQFQLAMGDRSALNLRDISIGQMMDYMKLTEVALNNLAIFGLRDKFNSSVSASSALSHLPLSIAAYKKGITITQMLSFNMIDLGVKVTGFTIPIIRKLYNMSDVDFGNAKVLLFGSLPTYIKETMNVNLPISHFYILSLDSITRAMLIHKNLAEATMDFMKDFGFVARNGTIGDIKAISTIHSTYVRLSSLFVLSHVISGINYLQFQIAMQDTSTFNLLDTTIGEMADYLKLSDSDLNKLSIITLRNKFNSSISASRAFSRLPVVVAAHRKGITIIQMLRMNVIDLAHSVTGLTAPLMQKLYKISNADLATARMLPFGGLPSYVNQTMNVKSQLNHFYTLSLDSITRAMLIHKNQTEGTMDFIKDFGFIARNVSIGEIKAIYSINSTNIKLPSLFMLSNFISGIDYSQFQLAMRDRSALNLKEISIGQMVDYMNLSDSDLNNISIAGLRNKFNFSISASRALARMPVAVAAHRKGITVMKVLMMNLIDLSGNITGFTVPIMQKLYKISDVDLATARQLPFGGLPTYVNRTMNVTSKVRHFYTLSLDSITRAMLIHKNQTEGTMDFIKDFGFIARSVSIGEIKLIYNISDARIKLSSLFMLSNLISGIDYSQFQVAMNDKSTLNLRDTRISEMTDYMNLSDIHLNKLSIVGLRNKFNSSVSASSALSRLPVAVAAHRKGIMIMQMLMMNIIDLAGNVTGFTVPLMRKLYNISDVDLAAARVLPFGGLPAYVNMTMNVRSQLNHFYTLSLDSITRAMLIHKNQTEGTMDFIKDFGFIARNVSIGEIKAIYSINSTNIKLPSLFMLSNLISGIDYLQFQMVMRDSSALTLRDTSVGQMADYLKLNDSKLEMLSILDLRGSFRISVNAGIVLSMQPVAVAAYKKGLSMSQLDMMNVIDVGSKVTGFTIPVIQKLYNISDADLANARTIPFGNLSSYVRQTVNVYVHQKHFKIMSFNSIYRAFIAHKNIILGKNDFVKDFNGLASSVGMKELSKIFIFSLEAIKQKTIPEFLDLIAGTNLSVVSNYSAKEIAALSSITFEEGLYFLKSRSIKIDFMLVTLNHFLQSIVMQSKVVPELFVPLDKLAIGNLMQTSILQLTRLGNLSQLVLHGVLNSSFISVNYFQRIKGLTLSEAFARGIFSISTKNVGQRTLMKVLQSIRNVKVFARLPFVVAAYYNGFGSVNLNQKSVATTIHNVLGFDVSTISTQLNIPAKQSVLLSLSSMTFTMLAKRLSQTFGRDVNNKQLYHISVYNLLDAVLTRNSTQYMMRAVDEAIRFISLRMKLHEVGGMYHISNQDLLSISLISLLTAQTDVQSSEVAKALNMSVVQEQLLNRVRIMDAQILLGVRNEIFDLTTERIGHRIIHLNAETIALFTPLQELLNAKSLTIGSLQQMKIPNFLTSVPSANIDQIFKRMNISKDSYAFLFSKSIAEIAAAGIIQLALFAKWHIFRIFWDFKTMISIGSDACKKYTTPCVANADCYDPPQHIFCRCKDGFSGNSTYCYDGCTNKQCPSGSTCSNVPGGSVVCRCTKPGYALKNNKCTRLLGRIFKVRGLKCEQAYEDSYKDTNSASFKRKAAEFESILFVIIRRLIFGCIGIRVTSIRRGSIIVDYSVIIDQQYQNVTNGTVLEASKKSLNDDAMLALRVNTSSSMSAQSSNICDIGGSDCDVNSKCIANSDGVSYTCKCNDGYKKDGSKCSKVVQDVSKEDDHTGVIVGVVVAVVVVIILVMAFVIYKKRHVASGKLQDQGTDLQTDYPFSQFRGSTHSSTTGIENKSYETHNI